MTRYLVVCPTKTQARGVYALMIDHLVYHDLSFSAKTKAKEERYSIVLDDKDNTVVMFVSDDYRKAHVRYCSSWFTSIAMSDVIRYINERRMRSV